MKAVIIIGILFAGSFYIIKMFTDYLLKRRIIKNGHFEKADILEPISAKDEEPQSLKSLKWALVALMAGLGMIVAQLAGRSLHFDSYDLEESMIPMGIELTFIGLGFLIYFFVAIKHKK